MLKPGGVFVFADHMAGSGAVTQRLIGLERARVKLGREAITEEIEAFLQIDEKSQADEGNYCESVEVYLKKLQGVGFIDVDCLWREFWLAVFVARKL